MAPNSTNQNVIVAYPSIGEAPPLPRQLLSKTASLSVDYSNIEPQLEEERVQSLLDQRKIVRFEQFSAYIGPSVPVIVPRQMQKKAMVLTAQTMIPIFEGDEDPRRHWFICETIWAVNDVDSEEKQMHQFVAGLRKRALTWYMNFTSTYIRTKGQIKAEFMAFFKMQEGSHLAAQKLKDIKQKHDESIRAYDQRLKDTLSLIPYPIKERLLVQWFVAGLLPQNKSQLRAFDFATYSDVLKKALQLETDDDVVIHGIDRQLEDKLTAMQKAIHDISSKGADLWCTDCMVEGHTKDTYRRREERRQDVRTMTAQAFCDICQESRSHSTKNCSFNLRHKKTKWCAICEESEHDTSDCSLNLRNKPNYQVY